jgi:hypothetical protein
MMRLFIHEKCYGSLSSTLVTIKELIENPEARVGFWGAFGNTSKAYFLTIKMKLNNKLLYSVTQRSEGEVYTGLIHFR